MKFFFAFFLLFANTALAQHAMQHGFILGTDDQVAAHLVATGHHSRQVVVEGTFSIPDADERLLYEERKTQEGVYFVLQAQNLDLTAVNVGTVLSGHIIESAIGDYTPSNRIVTQASFVVERILVDVANPFFAE